MTMREAWEEQADEWIRWARADGHDSFWKFHRDAFMRIVPPPGQLTVDVGSGEGRLGRHLQELGHRVVALDASATMARAAATYPGLAVPSVVADAARLPIADRSADLAIAFMSLQDIDGWEDAVAEVARVLTRGGAFALAIVHPINSAGGFVGESGDTERPFVIEGSYFQRRRLRDEVERDGLRMTFASEHRTIEDYTEALASAGFVIERIRELPDVEGAWARLPLFLHIRARRHPS